MNTTEAIVGLISGGGLTGLIAWIFRFYQTAKRGKLESEETLLERIKAQSSRDSARMEEAEKRADEAEATADEWRERLWNEQEKNAYYRAYMLAHGLKLPKWPPDDYQ